MCRFIKTFLYFHCYRNKNKLLLEKEHKVVMELKITKKSGKDRGMFISVKTRTFFID